MSSAPKGAEGDPTRYLQLLRDATEYLDIRGLKVGCGTAQRYPIEALYIPLTIPTTVARREAKSQSDEVRVELHAHVELQEALQSPKLVIVGSPGSGKTTFLQRVAFALSQALLGEDSLAAESRLGLNETPLPIRIRIGELAQHISNRKQHADGSTCPPTDESPEWLPDYLVTKSSEFDWGLDREFFRRKMSDGEAIFLLDGLDEAPGREVRKSISKLFENSVQAYQKSRFVVTTRPQAYTQRLRPPGFDQVEIAPLDAATISAALQR